MQRLIDPTYLSFPFRFKTPDSDQSDVIGVETSQRAAHVAQQIEQVLFTDPHERVFRPHFGAGLRTLVFEPNVTALRAVVRERLTTVLGDVLQGEVDLATLDIQFRDGEDNQLSLVISYKLVAIDQIESHVISLDGLNG
ncbi:MAG: GPW/gp25 family protein [Proteobacteria bacterium]|nr:GPW/gp25 family protein [Pseudomonadota bacterium]